MKKMKKEAVYEQLKYKQLSKQQRNWASFFLISIFSATKQTII